MTQNNNLVQVVVNGVNFLIQLAPKINCQFIHTIVTIYVVYGIRCRWFQVYQAKDDKDKAICLHVLNFLFL